LLEPPKPKLQEPETFPDIERPAGRLWSQQQKDLDAFFDDSDSISLEGADTLQEDWAQSRRDRLQATIDYEVQHEEKCMRELIEESKRVIDSDGKY